MPQLRRSNISITKERICIEAETPSLPKNTTTKRTTKNKKRKLDDEFSPRSPGTKYHVTKNTKQTKVVYNETRRSTRKTKNTTSNGNNSIARKKRKTRTNPTNVQQQNESYDLASSNNDDGERTSECMVIDINNDQHSVGNKCEKQVGDSEKQLLYNTTATYTNSNKIQESDDYQRKYFRLLETMECLQKQFLASQQEFEDHITANEVFIAELKSALEEKNEQVLCAQREIELSKTRNSELENLNLSRSKEIQNLNTKVERMRMTKTSKNVMETGGDNEESTKLQLTEQQDILDCYKILTGLSLQKKCTVLPDENLQSAYQSFTCSIKTIGGKDLQFQLSHDREFAELGYKPLECYSPETIEKICAFPTYLQSQIFFGNEQAPKFLIRLLQAAQEPKK